jgi:hypothetical protein
VKTQRRILSGVNIVSDTSRRRDARLARPAAHRRPNGRRGCILGAQRLPAIALFERERRIGQNDERFVVAGSRRFVFAEYVHDQHAFVLARALHRNAQNRMPIGTKAGHGTGRRGIGCALL